jgi:DMSO/TMAO reductase YedYZ molybdopterin-dependent catalytic subunit
MTQIKPYRVISGLGAGAGAMLAVMVVMVVVRYTLGLPTIPELMLNPILQLMGGQAFSDALDQLYYAGRPLLFASILEGMLVVGALLGLLYAWLARPNPETGRRASVFNTPLGGLLFGLVVGVLLNVVFLPMVGQQVFGSDVLGIFSASVIPLWLGMMVLGLVFGLAAHALLPPVPSPEAQAMVVTYEAPTDEGRRTALRVLGGAVLALLGGAGVVLGGTVLNQGGFTSPVSGGGRVNTPGDGSPVDPTPDTSAQAVPTVTPEAIPTATTAPTEEPTEEPTAEPTAVAQGEPTPEAPPTDTPPPPATETPVPPTSTPTPKIEVAEITPNESFYHVSKNFLDPSPSADGWTLEIKGLVDKPYSLTYAQLTALPAVEVAVGMMCISNPTGGGLIGNTRWKGVRLADLLKRAVPKKGVVDVAMSAVDGYTDSIPFEKAMDPDVVLVWEMGGKTLTSDHGFPARLLVPGIYGMKHVKWITSFELVNTDFKGYWQGPSQGWSDPAPVNTMSRIDFPAKATLPLGTNAISGIAFAGDRSISKVEISTDGGKTWAEAYLKPPLSSTSWVLWGYDWTVTQPGKYTVMVRATDGEGKTQTARKDDPYPNGATGYHTVIYQAK